MKFYYQNIELYALVLQTALLQLQFNWSLFVYNQSLDSKGKQCATGPPSLEKKILEHAGPVVNVRTLRNKFNASKRPTKSETESAMRQLQEHGFGLFVESGSAAAFIKQVPSEVDEGKLQYYMQLDSYKEALCRKNYDLPQQQLQDWLSKDPLGEKIKEYLRKEQENQD